MSNICNNLGYLKLYKYRYLIIEKWLVLAKNLTNILSMLM